MIQSDGSQLPVIVVGGGISGIACAQRLREAGHRVKVYERGHRLGGRMAVRTEDLPSGSHPVDIGAPYFTVKDEDFERVVQDWADRGLARPWTDTFMLATADGLIGTTSSPVRWSAAAGMRSLVEDLADGLDIILEREVREVREAISSSGATLLVDGEEAGAVVLAMPDPQAERLVTPALAERLEVAGRSWLPAVAVWTAWEDRWWPDLDAVFVDGSGVIAWVSDDGRSRGDDSPVLVAHTTGEYAAAHRDDIEGAVGAVLTELPRVLGTGNAPAPLWSRAHRWSLASSRHPHDQEFGIGSGALIAVCGDAWGERSRVEQAWVSGSRLGQALASSPRLPGSSAGG